MNDERRDGKRNSPLEMSGEEFRSLGHALVDRIAGFLDSLPQQKVTTGESPTEIRAALDAERTLPQRGADPAQLLDHAADLLMEHSLFNGHPRFWGYITSSAAPIGALGELLAAAVNPNVGAWLLSPMASEIEAQTIRWMAEMIDYPVTCAGLFVSGGNMANFVCFLAARQATCGKERARAGNGWYAGCAPTARKTRIHGFKKPRTLRVWARMRFAGSRRMAKCEWTLRRCEDR